MEVLAVIAGWKLRGDRLVRSVGEPVRMELMSTVRNKLDTVTSSRKRVSYAKRRKRRRRRRYMTDAELEAELELRRARRAKEQDVYKKGLERKKLNALEDELSKLKSELSTMSGKSVASVRFSDSQPPKGSLGPPPAAPPPPPLAFGSEDKPVERYADRRARELKANPRKPKPKRQPTLLDCIREAGENPQARLKKSGTIFTQESRGEEATSSASETVAAQTADGANNAEETATASSTNPAGETRVRAEPGAAKAGSLKTTIEGHKQPEGVNEGVDADGTQADGDCAAADVKGPESRAEAPEAGSAPLHPDDAAGNHYGLGAPAEEISEVDQVVGANKSAPEEVPIDEKDSPPSALEKPLEQQKVDAVVKQMTALVAIANGEKQVFSLSQGEDDGDVEQLTPSKMSQLGSEDFEEE